MPRRAQSLPKAELRPAERARLLARVNEQRFTDAERELRAITSARPKCADAWKLMGLVLWLQGKNAVAPLERAAALLPADPEAHVNLGNALRRAGRPREAAGSHRRALELRPEFPEAHNNLGSALFELGDSAGAIASYRRAIALKPDFATAHTNLARAFEATGQGEEGLASRRRALALAPGDSSCQLALADALFDLDSLDEARLHYEQLLERQPRNAQALIRLAALLRQRGEHGDSMACCRTALEQNPLSVDGLTLRGQLEADAGDFAAAEATLRRALHADAESVEALAALANLRRMTADDAGWLDRALALATKTLPQQREIRLRYALGKYYDDLGDFTKAFAQYARANSLDRARRGGLDRATLGRAVEQTIDFYSPERLASLASGARESPRPVFIVGMPRSGTTLAEQMLASHAQVAGVGELDFWSRAAPRAAAALAGHAALHASAAPHSNGSDVSSHDMRTPDTFALEVRALAQEYERLLARLAPDAARVIDKTPSNFGVLGLIHGALPGARIIHLQRDPRDTCLSIYFHPLPAGHTYANDLDDLAHYYSQYFALMEHWRQTLPADRFLELSYEEIIDEPERGIRRMLGFIGLPWDAACLDFHRTARTVTTFSQWQVRQPIQRASVGRWQNYRAHVGPLLPLAEARIR